MKKTGINKINDFSDLRKHAEAILSKSDKRLTESIKHDIKTLIHELDTHHIELLLQNEDLRNTMLKLEESRNKYFELFDLAPCGYIKLDSEGLIIDVNIAATKILAVNKEKIINRKFTDFIVDKYQDEFYKLNLKHNKPDHKSKCELKIKRPEQELWVYIELCSTKTVEDQSHSLLLTIINISKQKELQFFNNLTRNLNDAIFFIDPENSMFIDVNEQASISLGYTREELLSMGVVDIEAIIPDHSTWEKYVEDIYRKGSLLIEGRHKRKNGTQFPVEINITKANFTNQDYIIAIARDITKRKQAEKVLRLTEKSLKEITEKLLSILSNIPEVVYSAKADASGTILYISDRWKDWTGYSPDESYKDSEIWAKSIHPDDREKALLQYSKAISGGLDNSSEYRLINKNNNKIRWVYDHGIPIKNKQGKTIRYDGIVTDITEQKNNQKIIIQTQKMQAVGTLAGGMAHEFNNIIGIMMGYAQIILNSKNLTSNQHESISEIYKQGEKAASIIENVLRFSRKEQVEFKLLNLNDLINDAVKIIRLMLPPNIKVSYITPDTIPMIYGNPTQIQQAILNISNNSIHAVGKKQSTIKITLKTEKSCNTVPQNHSFFVLIST